MTIFVTFHVTEQRRGLTASCIRTHFFFTQARLSDKDPTCKLSSIFLLGLLLISLQGTDGFLASWTVVESGMYIIAACLVGLRPILSVSFQWIKKRVMNASVRNIWPRNRHSSGYKNEQDSMSCNLKQNAENVTKLQESSQDLERGRSKSIKSNDLHMLSEIQATNGEGSGEQNRIENLP